MILSLDLLMALQCSRHASSVRGHLSLVVKNAVNVITVQAEYVENGGRLSSNCFPGGRFTKS